MELIDDSRILCTEKRPLVDRVWWKIGRGFILFAGVILASFFSWQLLGRWMVNGAERFYLLVPPVALALYSGLAADGWRGLWAQRRPILRCLAILTIFATLIHLGFPLAAFPARGFWAAFEAFRPLELLLMIYFLASLCTLMVVTLFLLRSLCRRCVQLDSTPRDFEGSGRNRPDSEQPRPSRTQGVPHCSGPAADSRRWRLKQILIQEVLPLVLVVVLFLPLFTGAVWVHRVKIPNPSLPRDLLGRDFEEVSFLTDDGMTIRGWFIPASPAPSSRTLIICHGLAANRSLALGFQEVGNALQANVLYFDFRGHGDSDGHTTSMGYWERLDVLAAASYLRSQRPEQARTVIGLGHSMGATALLLAAAEAEPPFDGVILDSSFASTEDLTDQILELVPSGLRPCLTVPGVPLASLLVGVSLAEIRPEDRIGSIRAPVLLIHDRGDRLIPVEHAHRLYERAREPKSLWLTDNGGHGGSWASQKEYLDRVRTILR